VEELHKEGNLCEIFIGSQELRRDNLGFTCEKFTLPMIVLLEAHLGWSLAS
jgi:hypothetical protein